MTRHLRARAALIVAAWGVCAMAAGRCAGATAHTLTWNGTGWDGGWTDRLFPTNSATDTYTLLIDGGNPANSRVVLDYDYMMRHPTVDAVTVDAGDTLAIGGQDDLTILNDLTLNGRLEVATYTGTVFLPAEKGLSGSGLVDGVSVINKGGDFTIGAGITARQGTLGATGKISIGTPDGRLINQGSVVASNRTSVLTLTGASFSNQGRIEAVNEGVVAFDVPFSAIGDLGDIASSGGGRFRIARTLDNTGRTFAVNNSTGDWELTGTMKGGTFTSADGKALYIPDSKTGTLDGVMLNGELHVGQYAVAYFSGSGPVGTGTVILEKTVSSARSTGDAFIVPAGMTVVGRADFVGSVGQSNTPLVNRGRLVAERILKVNGNSFSNEGRIEVSGVFEVNAPFQLSDLGSYSNGGVIQISNYFENAGRTFTLTATTGNWELAGTFHGGVIETTGLRHLTVPEFTTAVLDDVRVNGRIWLGGTLRSLPSYEAGLSIPAGQVLSGNGQISFATSSAGTITGVGGLIIGEGIRINGTGGTVGQGNVPLVNRGVISADVAPGSVYGSDLSVGGSSITNSGTFEAKNGGLLRFFGHYTLADLGTLINNGGTVRFAGTVENTGGVLEVSAATGARQLLGTLVGGTVRTDAAHPLVLPGFGGEGTSGGPAFNGVTLDGPVNLLQGTLTITNGLIGSGEIRFLGQSTKLLTTDAMLVVEPGMSLRVEGQYVEIGDTERPLINRGTIAAGSLYADATLYGSRIENYGSLVGTAHTFLRLQGGLTAKDGSVVSLVLSSEPALASSGFNLDLSGDESLVLALDPRAVRGQPYLLATYTGNLIGTFDHVTEGFTVDYSTRGKIYATAVPEPWGGVLGLGVVGVLCARRGLRN